MVSNWESSTVLGENKKYWKKKHLDPIFRRLEAEIPLKNNVQKKRQWIKCVFFLTTISPPTPHNQNNRKPSYQDIRKDGGGHPHLSGAPNVPNV